MAIIVEFAQNTFMIGFWCTGLWLWTKRETNLSKILAIVCLLVSGIMGPIFIRTTEVLIDSQARHASLTWTDVGTMAVFTVFAFANLFYFSSWRNRKTDLVVGAALGLILSLVQGFMLPGTPFMRLLWHAIAMVFLFSQLVAGIRYSLEKAQTWWQFLLLVSVVVMVASALIVVVDYGMSGVVV